VVTDRLIRIMTALAVLMVHSEGRSQRAIAGDLHIDRRKVKKIVDRDAAYGACGQLMADASAGVRPG
jgi:hypothetical protein